MTYSLPRVVATQLPPAFNRVFQQQMPETELLQVPASTDFSLPPEVEILLAAPYSHAGGTLPEQPPAGWPFGLKWVQLISVGLDFYPSWMFQVDKVTSVRGTSANALAEFALAAIFAHAKQLPQLWIKEAAAWKGRRMADVSGATLGILGYGSIARALIPKAQALGMAVACCRHSERPFAETGVTRASSLGELMAISDHLLLAAPGTAETHHIVNRDTLAMARPGLHLINLARGSLIDDAALLGALDSKQLSRATLDVTHPEPLPAHHPFYSHPGVFLSPHNSVMTPGTMANMGELFGRNLYRYCHGEPLLEVVAR